MVEEADLESVQSQFDPEVGYVIEKIVRDFVAHRGYGPWYQREAWEYVKEKPYSFNFSVYLDEKYPNVLDKHLTDSV